MYPCCVRLCVTDTRLKLSCDRSLPCQRCIRTGRADQCTFDTDDGQPRVSSSHSEKQQDQHQSDEIRNLRAEVTQLRALLDKGHLQHHSEGLADISGNAEVVHAVLPIATADSQKPTEGIPGKELSDPRERSPRVYYSKHTLLQFFTEVGHFSRQLVGQRAHLF